MKSKKAITVKEEVKEEVKGKSQKKEWTRETFLMHALGRDDHENSNRRQ